MNTAFNCLALGATQTEMLEEAFPGYKAPITAAQMAEYICRFFKKCSEIHEWQNHSGILKYALTDNF
jgi:hypothetical protein